MNQIKNSYKILKSKEFSSFINDIGIDNITPQNSKKSIGENAFNFFFLGKIGLSGFTAYPKLINYLSDKDLSKLSQKLLSYQIKQIQNGKDILKELCANLGLFAVISCKIDILRIKNQSLLIIPSFLYRTFANLSIKKAQISMAEENDLMRRSILFHNISSAFILLASAYQNGKDANLLTYAKEIFSAYETSINLHEFLYANLANSLKANNVDDIFHLLDSSPFVEQYAKTVKDKELSEQLGLLLNEKKNELLSDAKTYFGGYCYENVIEMTSYEKTVDAIKNNYFRYICPNYIYLLNTCGRYYDEMMHYNIKMGKWNDLNIYDHKMIYMLAGWLKENRDYDCIRNISKAKLAHDITDYIITYIRNTSNSQF